MKNLKILALLCVFVFTAVSFTTKENPDVKKQLHDQIVKILGKTTDVISANEAKAEIVFTLNNKSEIVIISVDSDNKYVDSYVKNKLNYKRVKVNALVQGDIYKLPLTIKKES